MPRDVQAIPYSDSQCDISDVWHEETDPQADFNEVCVAHYDHADGYAQNERHEDVHCIVPTLAFLTVDDGHGPEVLDRERATECLGYCVIMRIEAAQFEELNQ